MRVELETRCGCKQSIEIEEMRPRVVIPLVTSVANSEKNGNVIMARIFLPNGEGKYLEEDQ